MNSITEQMIEAFGIMLLGMGLVFVFLTLLILGIKLVAHKFAPQPIEHMAQAEQPDSTPTQGIDPLMVAVITSAIHQYRAKA
ncbi:OadG family protein [uncultured Shewanella sp.]|uniref:OadG family protein n=1 Tax=Shewanella atlantica TaxID=271099 RepID=UPI002633F09B|nr:OadG family transporter subunit [uncultured Shewanella sp.]